MEHFSDYRIGVLEAIAHDRGTPCYVYFFDQVAARVRHLRDAFGGRFAISYAVKSNPNPAILRRLRGCVDTLDVSSAGEVRRAVDAGWPAHALSFTGPAKNERELREAMQAGTGEIVLESVDEAVLLASICRATGRRQAVLVRIAPRKVPRGFGVNMSGAPTQFGIDEEGIDPAIEHIRGLAELELRGLHIYSGTQCLSPASLVENYGNFSELFRRVCRTHALQPQRLVFGSGIGIPYYAEDAPVDLRAVAEGVREALDGLAAEFPSAKLVLETGRYLVGEAGVYLTRVIRKKTSRGAEICICDGGMNHHLAAAGHLGTVIFRNYRMFKVTPPRDAEERVFTLVGPLCTTIDMFGRQVKLPALAAGDVIAIECSGAYGLTASPIHFISHPPPAEFLVETAGNVTSVEECSMFRGSGAREFA